MFAWSLSNFAMVPQNNFNNNLCSLKINFSKPLWEDQKTHFNLNRKFFIDKIVTREMIQGYRENQWPPGKYESIITLQPLFPVFSDNWGYYHIF